MEKLVFLDIGALSTNMIALHSTSLLLALVCLLFTRKILSLGRVDAPPVIQVVGVRLLLLAYLSFEAIDIALLHALPEYDRPLYRGALSILTIFLAILTCNLFNKWARNRFGAEKVIDERKEIIATYYSRLTGLLFSVVVCIIVIYTLVKIWDMNSLLETTGFVGIIAVFLALTNPIWLPDIYYGLVILNSDMFQDGEVVRFDDDGAIYVINRVSLIYTTLLNVENNNKTVMRNSKILENKIENLTRRASIEGLRQSISFKVSYPRFSEIQPATPETSQHLKEEVTRFYERLEKMFDEANLHVHETCEGCIARNSKFEWGILNAGDYALEIIMYYHLAPLPPTKLTKRLRNVIYQTRRKIVHAVYMQSVIHGIELSTPTLINIGTAPDAAQAVSNMAIASELERKLAEP